MSLFNKLAVAAAVGFGAAFTAKQIGRQRHRMDFHDKVVVIAGGSRGLGLLMARLLVDQGAKVALLARDADELKRADAELAARGAKVLTAQCDITHNDEVTHAIDWIIDRLGRIDVLINNAGIIQVGPVEHMDLADFEAAWDTNLRGPLHAMLAVLPHMRRQRGGRIVNISSVGGVVAVPHLVPYSTSKFALVGLSQGMRNELVKDNILVTTVCPGLMRTGSPDNAQFKGQHGREFSWFATFDSLPITSIDARVAAEKILDAARHGDPHLTITISAKLARVFNALFPDLMASAMRFANSLLPAPSATAEGDESRTGRESRPQKLPAYLTRLSDEAAERNNETPTGSTPAGLSPVPPIIQEDDLHLLRATHAQEADDSTATAPRETMVIGRDPMQEAVAAVGQSNDRQNTPPPT